ncbi:Mitochondrial carrier protein, putative [Leishmania lindenbergi]|uniref:Mitochondrial carrier protein n=1 Tax=Leishmania lindenbergi TaxID=651832 RepID=A0AAW3AFL3_9TRYP
MGDSSALTCSVKEANFSGVSPLREGHDKDNFVYSAGPALLSGALQAILFNPIDRALYVRVKFRRRRFLDRQNFEHPFQGIVNAVVYRTLVGASYIFWQDSMRIAIERSAPAVCLPETSPQLNSMLIGLSAGSINGFTLNALQAVKFRMWNTNERGVSFLRTATYMYREGGVFIFFRGCFTTMVRDSIFGVVYETARRASAWKHFFDPQVGVLRSPFSTPSPQLPAGAIACVASASSIPRGDISASAPAPLLDHRKVNEAVSARRDAMVPDFAQKCGICAFISNLVAAVLASILSSPFNYVRSIVYGTPAGAIPLGYISLLKSFYTQLFYTYRHGKSYTDRHGVPELGETEHPCSAPASSSTATTAAERRWRHGGSVGIGAEVEESVQQTARRSNSLGSRLAAQMRTWVVVHHHHPKAAWMWANSRLNIGWGSLRVGVGMAMGQSLFYLAQEYARSDPH